MLVGGTMMSVGGLSFIAASSVFVARADNPASRLNAALGFIPGVGLGVSGGMMLARGIKKRRVYNDFEARTGIDVPHDGSGLIVGSISTIVPGLITGITAGLIALDPVARESPLPGALGGTSAALLVAGGSMLAVGIVKAKRYGKWVKGPYLHMPIAAPTRGGGMVAFSGQF
jgi:hypothetical protein